MLNLDIDHPLMSCLISDTTLRAIGKRAHPMHSMTSFSAQCILVSSIGYARFLVVKSLMNAHSWLQNDGQSDSRRRSHKVGVAGSTSHDWVVRIHRPGKRHRRSFHNSLVC